MTDDLAPTMSGRGQPLNWYGLYKKDYALATPESMSHPAKASWDLAFKILEHLKELGLIMPDSVLLDPMAGTGRFLLAGAAKGYRGIAVELEPYFKDLIGDCNCEGMTKELFKRMFKGQNRTRKLSYIKTRICPACQIEVDKRRQPKGPRTIFTSKPHYYDGNRAYLLKKGIKADITIIQGDARELSRLIEQRGCAL